MGVGIGGALRRSAASTAAVLALAALAGCAALPDAADAPAPRASSAQPPRAGGPLATLEARLADAHGAELSGFLPLERNEDALAWRLALIDSARHTLDLQYYVWFADRAGGLMTARLVAAADRGVRVRLLVDDLNTALRDMGTPELRDADHALLDRHPNIEVRVFNPWRGRGWTDRIVEGLARFDRLNRRMHAKQMIADNRAAIVGGRNIGDEYFGLNPAFNFHDLDVLGVGPVAREASAVFDRFWNSGWARALPEADDAAVGAQVSSASARTLEALRADPRARRILAGRADWADLLDTLPAALAPGRGRVHADPASRDASARNRMPETVGRLMRSARREVLIANAYVIPDDAFLADLRALAARGVTVRILTNSLASHDVPAVNSHYEPYREVLLRAGADLHELRADPAVQRTLVDTPPVAGRFVGLHVKAMVVDRERAFVGSMNLDPRSEVLNAEMGVVVDGAPLAATLARAIERDMTGANSWRVALDADGALRWTSDAGTTTTQPARSAWQRVENVLFKLLPRTMY